MSRANRNALGLRDRRSRLLFHVAAFIEKLEEKQPTGVGWLLENVDTSGDERLYIKESEKYITKIIGRALVIDEAGCGANHHRVRRFWTNMGDVERLKLAWERRADMQPRLLREVLPPHLRPHVNLPTPPNGVRVNKPGQPRALPTILARSDSDAYSGEGAGMLFNINTGEWERPTVHLKEELFGYEPNVIHGISLPDHERLIGNAMGLHSVAWIVGQLFVEQQRLRDLEELERAARAAQAAQRAERERREQRRMQRSCGRAWQQLCQQALCCWLLLIWLGGTSMHFGEASRLGNTTVLAMFVAVMVRASARYRREVTATSRAGRRAFGANAVSDGGGTAERSSAAAWANRGYTQASMNDHVEDVRSLKDPEKHWRCGRECEASQQQQLVELCDSFWDDVWVWSVSDLPAVNHWEFRIPTTNTQPIKRPKYRLSKTEWDFVDSWCKELLAAGAIRESQSPYSIPVVCPPKKDDDGNWTGIRVCLDARPLNSVTESWAYCMPKTDELLSKVAGARMYSGFDAKSAFHQLPIAEEDRHKTAFWGSDRQYEWCRMAMGFKNASQAWQRVMDEALGDLPFVAVYADDICVFSGAAEMSDAEVFQQHLQHLETVFQRLATAGIRLAPGKGRMAVRQIAFLGHWVDGEGVFPQHSKVEAVVKMPPPTDVAGLRRFLGMVGYYGKFIEQVAVKRKPLTKLTGKVPWEWGSEQQRAFEQLKADLVSAPVLRNPDWGRPFILHTDFSGAGLGAVLAQEDDEGQEYVVEFASRTCQGAEPNYASYEGECLAMLYGMDKFRYYLFGRQFVVVTDHRPLEWLMNTAQLRGKLARWAMRLSEYDFVVRYRKGVHHVNADCLSRGPVEGDPTELDGRGEFSPEGTVRHAAAFWCATAQSSRQPELSAWARRRVLDTAHEGTANGDLVAVTGELTAGPRRGDPWMDAEAMAELQAGNVNMPQPYARYTWRNNILWYLHKDGTHREVPPPSERDTVIMDVHVKMGHLGRDRLRSVIAASYFWPGMVEDVARVKKACPDCDRLQHRPGGTSGRPKAASPLDMQPLPHFGMFYRWHLDLAGPFEATRSRNVWVLVMVEAASKWVELVPLRTKEAANIRQAFQERVLARFAAPGEVCTDGGTEFSGEFHELLVEHDIDHPKPLPYHPQPNGLAEGMVKTVKEALMRYVVQPGKRVVWDTFLPSIELGYRCSKQASTRYSPYELVYGRAPVFPAQARALFEESAVDFNSPEGMWELMTVRAERLALMVPTAMHNVEAAQHREVMRYRRRRAGLVAPGVQRFSPGDFVYVQQRQQDALDPRVRPAVYKVYEVNDNGVVVIQGADGDTARVRVEELARCAVPYVVLPAGFEDPNMACEECDGRVSTQRNPIIICEDLINNDFNPVYQTEMCEDALESFVYQCARDVTATVAMTTMMTTTMTTTQPRLEAPFIVVTSPWFQLLDLALPIMASCADILFVQVPIFYIAQGPSPRMQWLRHLGDCGRLHIIAGDMQRNRTTRRSTLWLAVFRDNELRERELRAEWRHSVASIHFHTEACAGDQHH
eukprot:jgi/Tetstr1/448714/TSEL_035951.t1